jgi:hypothetical protein
MSSNKIGRAFLISPIIVPILFYFLDLAQEESNMDWTGILVIGAYAYGAAILFGIPLMIWFKLKNITNKIFYLIPGFIIGILMGSLYFRVGFYLFFCGLTGLLSASIFWRIVQKEL